MTCLSEIYAYLRDLMNKRFAQVWQLNIYIMMPSQQNDLIVVLNLRLEQVERHRLLRAASTHQ